MYLLFIWRGKFEMVLRQARSITSNGFARLKTSVADPWQFGVDPDPRIHTWLSIWIQDPDPAILVIDLQDINEN